MRGHHHLPSGNAPISRTGSQQPQWSNGGGASVMPPWNKQQYNRQQPSRGVIVPEERYEPLPITHETVTTTSSTFCCSCECPMEIRIRLEPCYHLVCLDCFSNIAKHDTCPSCGASCTLAMPLHPNDSVYECSGTCFCNSPRPRGRVFLNSRSLKCHEMLFHSDDMMEMSGQSIDDKFEEQAVPVAFSEADQATSTSVICPPTFQPLAPEISVLPPFNHQSISTYIPLDSGGITQAPTESEVSLPTSQFVQPSQHPQISTVEVASMATMVDTAPPSANESTYFASEGVAPLSVQQESKLQQSTSDLTYRVNQLVEPVEAPSSIALPINHVSTTLGSEGLESVLGRPNSTGDELEDLL